MAKPWALLTCLVLACQPHLSHPATSKSPEEMPVTKPKGGDSALRAPAAIASTSTARASNASPPSEGHDREKKPRSLGGIYLGTFDTVRVEAIVPSGECESDPDSVRMEVALLPPHDEPQIFAVETIGTPSVCTEYRGDAFSADFNFDGLPDIAVPIDHSGPYGSVRSAVFLAEERAVRFFHSEPLSDLSGEYMDLPDPDPKTKRLTAYSKSGCCIHWHSEFTIENNVPVWQTTVSETHILGETKDDCKIEVEVKRRDAPSETSEKECE